MITGTCKILYHFTFRYAEKDTWVINGNVWLKVCSNLKHPLIVCVNLSNFCHFSPLVVSTHPLLFYRILSPYQTFGVVSTVFILSNFCHLLTTLSSTHSVNVPALHTTNTIHSPVLSSARSLHQ